MLTTGMSISGKISVGVRSSTTGVSKRIASASTINVYGRESANRTIHMGLGLSSGSTYGSLQTYSCAVYFGASFLDSAQHSFGYAALRWRGNSEPGLPLPKRFDAPF